MKECDFNKVELSPDGKAALVWRSFSGPLNQSQRRQAIRDFIIVGEEGKAELKRVRFPLISMQWLSPPTKFAAINERGQVFIIHGSKFQAARTVGSIAALSSLNLQLQGFVNDQQLQTLIRLNPTSLDELQDRVAKEPVIVSPGGIYWIKNGSFSTAIFSGFSKDVVKVVYAKENLYAYSFAGLDLSRNPARLVGYGILGGVSGDPFVKPIYDQQTGLIAGSFSPKHVNLSAGQRRISGFTTSSNEKFFLSASFNSHALALLESDIFGNLNVVFIDGNHSKRHVEICRKRETQGLEIVNNLKVELISRGFDSGVAALRVSHSNSRKRLFLYFGGGPLGDVVSDMQSITTREFASHNADQVFVAYPGSVGLGYDTSTAFKEFDSKLLQQFIRSLEVWVRDEGYTSISVLGTSFGALPAYEFSKRIRSYTQSTHLIAPLMIFKGSDISLGQANQYSAKAQRFFELGVFGDIENRHSISSYFDAVFSKRCKKLDVTLYFAADDALIDEHHLPRCLENSRRRVYEKVGHGDLTSDPAFLADLRSDVGAGLQIER
jgi:hypothetical protein